MGHRLTLRNVPNLLAVLILLDITVYDSTFPAVCMFEELLNSSTKCSYTCAEVFFVGVRRQDTHLHVRSESG